MFTDNEPLSLENYNPDWAQLYEQEENLLKKCLADYIVDIQHIGSTSVPGLAAKPVIDIQITVDNIDNISKYLPELGRIDYVTSAPNTLQFLCKSNNHKFHLYIEKRDSNEGIRRIVFRDYLRANPRGAQEYENLKRAMAEKFSDDPSAYVDAKTAFITLALCMYDQSKA